MDLAGQFLFSRSASLAPAGWVVRRSEDWCLATHPTLPVIEICGREGTLLGWLLGYPITPDGTVLPGGGSFPVSSDASAGAAVFERSLYALGGRFAAIVGVPRSPRVYLDPCGSLAVVFCPEASIVASNLMLVPPGKAAAGQEVLLEALEDLGWYYGLTPRHGIERLLPNHVLDLATWTASRHWPNPDDLRVTKDVGGAVSEIASILERQIAAVARAGPCYVSLTAGRHTRMLLACAREYLDRITFFTIGLPDGEGRHDVEIAEQIARRFGLAHVCLRWEEPTPQDLEEYVYRTGGCLLRRERAARASRTVRQLDPTRAVLHGLDASLGEAEWWCKADLRERAVSCRADLLDPYNLPAVAPLVERAERWRRALPTRNVIDVLGLRALEQRIGCWGAPQQYGHPGTVCLLSPYCHRRVVQLKLTLPVWYRWRDRLPDDLLKSRWPELLGFAFDKAFGLRGAPPLPHRVWRLVSRYVSPIAARGPWRRTASVDDDP